MRISKKATLSIILVLLLVTIATTFIACDIFGGGGEPYYGTYYGGKQNGAYVSGAATIDKDYFTLEGQRFAYTYNDGVIMLSTGVQIIVAENNQITYLPKNILWKYGTSYNWDSSIRQRDGYFSGTLYIFNDTYSTIETRLNFNSDGTYEFLHLTRNGYERGNYYLNSGVLTLQCQQSLRADIPQNSERYWYIDKNYSIYGGVMLKDASVFAHATSNNNTTNTPNTPSNGNTGGDSTQSNTYTVIWKNYDGSILETDYDVKEGSRPTYDGATPTREESDGYTYTFTGWSPSVSAIYSDTTYTAQYSSKLKQNAYTVTWKNYDGTILEIDNKVLEGSTPKYDGTTPTREEEGYIYTFTGWSPSISSIYSNKTYTAQFDKTIAIPNLPTNTQPLLENANTNFDGNGTEQNPYLIKTSAQLLGMGEYADKHFALANDITLPLNVQDSPNFKPLFSDEKPFNATFDGRGYTIKNLYIYNTDTYYTGLFASVGESGVVKNVKLDNVRIFGSNYIGGITGLSFGTIEDCQVSGSITYVPANNYQVNIGGIVGYGSLDKCSTAVEIKVSSIDVTTYIGGLVGRYLKGKAISNSFSTGNIAVNTDKSISADVGGLVGYSYNSLTITSSYNTGNIVYDAASASSPYNIGGLAGRGASIINCYNTGDITAKGYANVGGLVGDGEDIISSYNTGDITVGRGTWCYVGGLAGNTGSYSRITSSYNTGDITVVNSNNDHVGGLAGVVGYSRKITSSYNIGKITAYSNSSSYYVGGLVGYGDVTVKNSHWLFSENATPINAVGYDTNMGVPTNIGATKHTDIEDFYDLAGTLNEGLDELAFEHKTPSSLPTLIKKEN